LIAASISVLISAVLVPPNFFLILNRLPKRFSDKRSKRLLNASSLSTTYSFKTFSIRFDIGRSRITSGEEDILLNKINGRLTAPNRRLSSSTTRGLFGAL